MFLVHSEFREPEHLTTDEVAERNRRESDAAAALQREGILVQLWREVGTRNSWGVWNADSEQRLAELLAILPWSPHMTFESYPISLHPNALDRGATHPSSSDAKVSE